MSKLLQYKGLMLGILIGGIGMYIGLYLYQKSHISQRELKDTREVAMRETNQDNIKQEQKEQQPESKRVNEPAKSVNPAPEPTPKFVYDPTNGTVSYSGGIMRVKQ